MSDPSHLADSCRALIELADVELSTAEVENIFSRNEVLADLKCQSLALVLGLPHSCISYRILEEEIDEYDDEILPGIAEFRHVG